MRILSLVKEMPEKFEGATSYDVSPSDLYPATIGYIKRCLAGLEELPPCVERFMLTLKSIQPKQWELALTPKDEVADEDRNQRVQALELARLVFTAMLREESGPIHLHILADDGSYAL